MPERTIYFDYNATTPLDAKVREEMLPFFGSNFGNPSSIHRLGRQARSILDDAHERVAQVWSCKPSEVVFTSGGTESVNLAIFGVARRFRDKGRHIITSQVEHHAVLHACEYLGNKEGFEVTYLPVNEEGIITAPTLESALRPDTILVSIMAANNEIGTIQPIAELGKICQEHGVLFHTDAVQWFGKEPFSSIHQFNANLVSACAHKYHGPKGAGALFIRSPLRIDPILFGGAHEDERRAGTENLAAIVGFAKATELFVGQPVFSKGHLAPLAGELISALQSLTPLGVGFRGSFDHRLTNTVAFTVRDCDSISLLANLDLAGICASSGSACSTGSLEPSHVILALGSGREAANSLVRFSLGRESTADEVRFVTALLPETIHRAQGTEQAPGNL